jgi:hypothetical protein
MRYLIILASLALACGAEAPSPSESDAAAAVDGNPYDTANGCPVRHARIGAECISLLDDACGPRRGRCAVGTVCALVGGGGPLLPEDVRCVRE